MVPEDIRRDIEVVTDMRQAAGWQSPDPACADESRRACGLCKPSGPAGAGLSKWVHLACFRVISTGAPRSVARHPVVISELVRIESVWADPDRRDEGSPQRVRWQTVVAGRFDDVQVVEARCAGGDRAYQRRRGADSAALPTSSPR